MKHYALTIAEFEQRLRAILKTLPARVTVMRYGKPQYTTLLTRCAPGAIDLQAHVNAMMQTAETQTADADAQAGARHDPAGRLVEPGD